MTLPYRLHYAPDNASLIIRLVLEEMGLPYETVLVDRSAQAQNSAAYLKLNPTGKIPALETPNGVISETGAILLMLSELPQTAPSAAGAHRIAPPPNSPERLVFLKWFFFVVNTLHPDLQTQFYLERHGPAEALPDMRHRLGQRLHHHLQRLDDWATQMPNDRPPSLLDYYIAVCLRWSALYPRDNSDWFLLSRYPALKALALALETRPAVQRAQAAEGLGPTPFTAPQYATPPEGAAT
ncbi:MAG: glutathione S-transferase N-terminal domain-containing protein [Thalassovita sp.]